MSICGETRDEKYLLNLFSIEGVCVEVPTMWLFKNSMKDNLYNAHLLVRYIAIERFYNRDDSWWKVYNEMQRKRVAMIPIIPREKAENEEAFKKLIMSFEKDGFIKDYPILVNKDLRLVDGSHRLALALYFKIEKVPITITKEYFDLDPEYSLDWFKEHGFNDIVAKIVDKYDEILGKGETL